MLAQLPQPSCPVADVALQQLLPKILGYLKKQLQVGVHQHVAAESPPCNLQLRLQLQAPTTPSWLARLPVPLDLCRSGLLSDRDGSARAPALPHALLPCFLLLQDADSVVREASSDAMAAYAQGCARLWGCAVPATTATPIVKVVFDVLAEQKKEAQMGASQALLKVCSALWGTSEMLAAAAAVCVVAHSNC